MLTPLRLARARAAKNPDSKPAARTQKTEATSARPPVSYAAPQVAPPARRAPAPPRATARETAKPPRIRAMTVRPRDGGWALLVDDLAEPAWIVRTRKAAVAAARDAARFHGAALRVLTRSGKVSQSFDAPQAGRAASA